MELHNAFYFFNFKKEGFIDSSSIIAIRDSKGVTCIEVGGGGEKNISKTTGILESAGIKISDVHRVIISHTHADHMGAIGHFKSINPDIYIINHELDAPYMTNNSLLNDIFESQMISKYFPGTEFDVLEFYKLYCPISEAKTDLEVNERDVIPCGDYNFEVIHTPGHHPGHISLYEKDLKILFVGDMVGMDIPFYNTVSGGVSGFLDSLEKFNALSLELIIPSHGDLIKNPYEAINKSINKLKDREQRVLNELSGGPKSFTDLLPSIIRFEHFYIFPGAGILSSHLNKLIKENIVKEEENNYFSLA